MPSLTLSPRCTRCNLHTRSRNIVWGYSEEPLTPPIDIFLLAEAPGNQEDRSGIPFSGKTGLELDKILGAAGLSRLTTPNLYITNLIKCHPPRNNDPTPDQIEACSQWLLLELNRLQPRLIVAVGRFATRAFMPDVNMEVVHGRLYWATYGGAIWKVLPVYHPAAGLRQPNIYYHVREDFKFVGQAYKHNLEPEPQDPLPTDYYVPTPERLRSDLDRGSVIALDTETVEHRHGPVTPWCLTYSTQAGTAGLIRCDETELLRILNAYVSDPANTTIMHNAIFDVLILSQMGVNPARILDTLIMAYLLQSEPKELKVLSARYCNMKQRQYLDVVADATHRNAMAYLAEILERDQDPSTSWAPIEPILVWDQNKPRIKHPWSIPKRAARILMDQHFKGADAAKRWGKVELDAGRRQVQDRMGIMPIGNLGQVPSTEALQYACADADATFRLYPILWDRLQQYEGLSNAFWDDMGVLPMAADMQIAGIQVDRERFKRLSAEYDNKLGDLESKIGTLAQSLGMIDGNSRFNPGSHPKVRVLLYDKLKLKPARYTKETGLPSTDDDSLALLLGQHEVVQWIRDWRMYQKLVTTYGYKPLSRYIQPDGRVHAKIHVTSTATGRMSASEPNLMAQPVRTKEGRGLRQGFIAKSGCMLVSSDYCLVGDTPVTTIRGIIPIQDIQPGDGVLSCSNGTDLSIQHVTAAAAVGVLPVAKLTTDDGAETICTYDHTWMRYSGRMAKTSDLKPGDRLAHVKSGHSGRYPTWYVRSHMNYIKKHVAVCRYAHGACPDGMEVDHIDGDVENSSPDNLRYMAISDNRAQGGRRYWRDVRNGRSDSTRLHALRKGIKSRRSYAGPGNPNYGKRSGETRLCPVCGCAFYTCPSANKIYCSAKCYHAARRASNHKVVAVKPYGTRVVYQITVENTHTYVLGNGMVSGNSQIELRVMAHVSQDPVMMEVFLHGQDIHDRTASEVFGVPVAQIDKYKHRLPAKRVNFGIPYGMTEVGLHETLLADGADPAVWTLDRCAEFIEEWLTLFSGVRDMMNRTRQQARLNGYVQDMWGRIRITPAVRAFDKYVVAKTLREACNMPIQSGAQGVIKKAMAKLNPIYKEFRAMGFWCWPVMQIHDDILSEVDVRVIDAVVPLIESTMESAVQLSIPTPVDPEVGYRWGKLKSYTPTVVKELQELQG
jgi:uracil-DNA glycosylase family 4